jgi:hypothetical protein
MIESDPVAVEHELVVVADAFEDVDTTQFNRRPAKGWLTRVHTTASTADVVDATLGPVPK